MEDRISKAIEQDEQQPKATKADVIITCFAICLATITYTFINTHHFNKNLDQTKVELRQTQADLTKTTSLLRLTQDELEAFKSNVTNEIVAIDKEFNDLDGYLAKQHKLNEKLVLLSDRLATNVATNNYYIEKSITTAIGLTEHTKLLAKRLDQHDVKIEKQNGALKAILETIELYH